MPRNLGSAFAGIFLLASSIILFQIALTRVFAIMMWHHFAYMVVSIALLGFGAAGSILTARRDALRTDSPLPSLVTWSSAYGLSVMLAFCFATLVEIDTLKIWKEKANIVALLLFFMIIAVPMLLGGLAIGQALTRMAKHVNRLYFFDLLGSAAGGGMSVLLLDHLDSATTIMIAGSLGCAAGVLFALGAGAGQVIKATPALLVALAVVVGFTGGSETLRIPAMEWPVPYAPSKEFAAFAAEATDRRLPSATAEVEVTTNLSTQPAIGGNFGIVDFTHVEGRFVAQDGTAPTMLFKGAADIESFDFLDDTQAASAYVAMKARGGREPDVLVIGVGGGVDVMKALYHGARHVTAVEINRAMIRMVTEEYDEYIGGLFTPGAHPLADRIELVNREGRSYMRHRDDEYDVIQMSGVDSFTALSTGAYTLAESYLYTTEAVKEFYDHLKDGGYINYSRFTLNHPKKPRETLRLSNIAYTALAELGIDDPAAQILVFQGHDWASTMIKRGRFTRAEVDALKAFADAEGFLGIVFDPLRSKSEAWEPEIQSASVRLRYGILGIEKRLRPHLGNDFDGIEVGAKFAEAYAHEYEGRPNEARRVMASIVGGFPKARQPAAAAGFGELLKRSVAVGRENARGFADKRNTFAELLRGTPAERRAFVAGYAYDITPCTDDTPFFFNYYRYDQLFGGSDEGVTSAAQDRYHPDFPVGHAVLLASLVQISLLAFVLIILPLRTLRREGVATPGKWRYLGYFSALGLGFMFIEIVLMQKMVIFLGHPTYALSIVLTSLLGFAGVGSLLAGRIRRIGRKQLLLLLAAVVAAIAFEAFAINFVIPRLLGWSLPLRMAACILVLMPLGLALGMPFPSGIRIVEAECPQLLPWGWAINGFLSVLASILCIMVSQQTGFTNVLYIAAGIYALGILAMKPQAAAAAS